MAVGTTLQYVSSISDNCGINSLHLYWLYQDTSIERTHASIRGYIGDGTAVFNYFKTFRCHLKEHMAMITTLASWLIAEETMLGYG